MKRYQMRVYGLVQGVGFRYFVSGVASRYNICGWVKNNYDGTVEIDAEGKAGDMDIFIQQVKKGPRYSSVENVVIEEVSEIRGYSSFSVEY